jgi:predicted  nucleic acid-binding Zn-ribbon protein
MSERVEEVDARFKITLGEANAICREMRLWHQGEELLRVANERLAHRPAEPSPRITREHYDTAYQRAVDASVRGEATVKDALYRELGVAGSAPRALPTREELVDRYSQFAAGRPGAECQVAADWAIGIIHEHASPADDGVLLESLDLARRQRDEAERERDWAQSAMRQAIAVLSLKDADADPKCDDAWWLVEGCKGVADALKDLHAHIAVVERERDALRQELAEVTGQAEQVDGDLALLRRERDEARAQLACERDRVRVTAGKLERADDYIESLEEHREGLHTKIESLEARLCEERDRAGSASKDACALDGQLAVMRGRVAELEAQLAARPEPVVIDEALAERVCEELLRRHGSYGTKEGVLAALRSVLGEKVSVAAPRTDDQRAYELLSDECGVLINECRDHRAELDKLRAELQAAQEERDRHEGANILNRNALRLLREQHEALRAALDVHISAMEEDGTPISDRLEYERGFGAACRSYGKRLRALLKPATPEAPPMPADTDRISWVNASPADALRPNDRHAQRPASEMPRPASLAPLTARVERQEAALRCFLTACGKNGPHDAANEALSMLDAGKQEVG